MEKMVVYFTYDQNRPSFVVKITNSSPEWSIRFFTVVDETVLEMRIK